MYLSPAFAFISPMKSATSCFSRTDYFLKFSARNGEHKTSTAYLVPIYLNVHIALYLWNKSEVLSS